MHVKTVKVYRATPIVRAHTVRETLVDLFYSDRVGDTKPLYENELMTVVRKPHLPESDPDPKFASVKTGKHTGYTREQANERLKQLQSEHPSLKLIMRNTYTHYAIYSV